jgi:hypothetical protein
MCRWAEHLGFSGGKSRWLDYLVTFAITFAVGSVSPLLLFSLMIPSGGLSNCVITFPADPSSPPAEKRKLFAIKYKFTQQTRDGQFATFALVNQSGNVLDLPANDGGGDMRICITENRGRHPKPTCSDVTFNLRTMQPWVSLDFKVKVTSAKYPLKVSTKYLVRRDGTDPNESSEEISVDVPYQFGPPKGPSTDQR